MTKAVTISVVRLAHGADLTLPTYATADSAGMDLMSAEPGDVTLAPGTRAMIATGLAMQLPSGFEAQVRPRSGLAAKHGITVLNSPGTIDADYRGEVKVILINLGDAPVTLARGERETLHRPQDGQLLRRRLNGAAVRRGLRLDRPQRLRGGKACYVSPKKCCSR